MLVSCTDKLERENQSLQEENQKLLEQVSDLEQRIKYLEHFAPNPLIRDLDNKEVIKIFQDHNSFYNSDARFKNLKIKKVGHNVYDISYLTMNVSGEYLMQWASGVSKLTMGINDSYKISLISGPLLSSN